MNSEQITAFLQEHWYIASVIIGVVILIGAIRNWNWLCDPTGKPDSHRYGRGSRRVIFFLLGVLLIVVRLPAGDLLPAGCPSDRGEHLGIRAEIAIKGAIP